ncbi:hypothetical protein [Synechococcus sp. W4D4]|uniref:hypothetical protein n=1 Tax=Synechococcus sp. W4D4 TaxID=3392294 RepID=UPI0039ED1E69
MRRFLPLLIGVALMMLTGCVDKRELCAQANVGNLSDDEVEEIYEKLGIKKPYSATTILRLQTEQTRQTNELRIERYCEFHKN